jgi:hypothetical protein
MNDFEDITYSDITELVDDDFYLSTDPSDFEMVDDSYDYQEEERIHHLLDS